MAAASEANHVRQLRQGGVESTLRSVSALATRAITTRVVSTSDFTTAERYKEEKSGQIRRQCSMEK